MPSFDTITLPLDSVLTDSVTTLPSLISNSNVVIVTKPSGATVSSSAYLPSFSPVISALLPLKVTSVSLSVKVLPSTFTPSRFASLSFAVSLNVALFVSGTGFAPRSVLLIVRVVVSLLYSSFSAITDSLPSSTFLVPLVVEVDFRV